MSSALNSYCSVGVPRGCGGTEVHQKNNPKLPMDFKLLCSSDLRHSDSWTQWKLLSPTPIVLFLLSALPSRLLKYRFRKEREITLWLSTLGIYLLPTAPSRCCEEATQCVSREHFSFYRCLPIVQKNLFYFPVPPDMIPRTHPGFWPPPLRWTRLNRQSEMKWWLLPSACDIPFGLFLESCWR